MFNIKYYYDLHIHSVLSPCADTLMSPNNIMNMAMLKELDFIAITDHNSTMQLKVIKELQESYDFVIIPGVEVSVDEGFDVLCYFKTFEDAIQFNSFLEPRLNGSWGSYTKEDQVITDIYDLTLDEYDTPLRSTNITYKELFDEVQIYDGAIILAHIDRPSCTVLNSYKLKDIEFDGIEIQPYRKDEYLKMNKNLLKYKIFHNSDSHSLLTMSEKENSIELEEKTLDAFFKYLKG